MLKKDDLFMKFHNSESVNFDRYFSLTSHAYIPHSLWYRMQYQNHVDLLKTKEFRISVIFLSICYITWHRFGGFKSNFTNQALLELFNYNIIMLILSMHCNEIGMQGLIKKSMNSIFSKDLRNIMKGSIILFPKRKIEVAICSQSLIIQIP